MTVYRYRLEVDIGAIQNQVPGTPTFIDVASLVLVDVDVAVPDAATQADLDAAMLLFGFVFVATDPATPIEDAAAADLPTGTPVEISDSTNSAGTGTALALANHVHSHGTRGGGTLHAVAVAGFPEQQDSSRASARRSSMGLQQVPQL